MDDNIQNELNSHVTRLISVLEKEISQYEKILSLESMKKDKITTTTFYDITPINDELDKCVDEALLSENERVMICNRICYKLSIPLTTNFKELINKLPNDLNVKLVKYYDQFVKILEEIQLVNETNSAIILDNLKLINYSLSQMTGEHDIETNYGDPILNRYNPRPVIISTMV